MTKFYASSLAERQADFKAALIQTREQTQQNKGIGTLKEKTIHATLKNFYAPSKANQEITIGGYVADIVIDQQIIEIQTRHFHTLRKKLDAFLPHYHVTIVYPIAAIKWLYWIQEGTGEISPRRKSPKAGNIYQIIPELYQIKSYLHHPHLHFILPLMEIEEYRLLNGWSLDGKKGATRYDGFPCHLIDEYYLGQQADYKQFLPLNLPSTFTSKDYQQHIKCPMRYAVTGLQLLHTLGIVRRIGKKGRAFLYQVSTTL